MSQSDIGDGLHLAVPNLYTQMSQERQRGGGQARKEEEKQTEEEERERERARVQLSQTAGDVQLSGRLDYSLKSAL